MEPSLYKPNPWTDLWHGDAREIPIGKVDAIITDPPWPGGKSGIAGEGEEYELLRDVAKAWPDMTDRVIVTLGCGTDPCILRAIPKELPFLRATWMRRIPPNYHGTVLIGADVAYVFGKGWLNSEIDQKFLPTETLANITPRTPKRNHPCSRPEQHLLWLVHHYTRPGQLVLDPFSGSGTTLYACARLGRRSIGIEIDETHVRESIDWLSGTQPDLTNFASELAAAGRPARPEPSIL